MFLRENRLQHLAVALHHHAGLDNHLIGIFKAFGVLINQLIVSNNDRLAGLELLLRFFSKRRAGDADKNQHHPEVYDVAAVPAFVFHQQPPQRNGVRFTIGVAARHRPTVKLGRNRDGDKNAERKRNERINMTHAGGQ